MIKGVGKDSRTTTEANGAKQSELPYAFQHLDPNALFEMAKVMKYGAEKYGLPKDNWRKISVESHLNHMISHAYAYLAGDTSDDHLAHMACRAMGALQVSLQQPQIDKCPKCNSTEYKVLDYSMQNKMYNLECAAIGCTQRYWVDAIEGR